MATNDQRFVRSKFDASAIFHGTTAYAALGAGANTSTVLNQPLSEGATIRIEVVSVSGTNPTLDVVAYGSPDNSNWFVLGTFAQITAAGSAFMPVISPNAQYVKLISTVGGSNTPIANVWAWLAK